MKIIKDQLNNKELEGYELMKGAIICFSLMVVCGLILMFVFALTLKPIDNSDFSKYKRSGFKILTDYKTGTEYLSDGHGGLIKR